ncbi:zinc-regulated protein 8-like [Gossypium australe]|uniref:Zinc-regulated protein 8-like n=1 Tax=Gossypium australe TaxID=47621 RepID=A0A5B6UB13_9ROSI|nr:zinc-regulated protein 8-like [Gossypium australe]
MMGQKHLQELLEEDQEPFHLNKYIADRRCQLKKPSPQTHLQLKKPKPISQTSKFPSNFCKNTCFFSFHDSPDPRKSPLLGFPSPCKSPNAIFLHIPARTAALLLEAALRIQKHSSSKTKHHNGGAGFGFFGSILKRITHRNRNRKWEIANDGAKVSVKDILRWDPAVDKNNLSQKKMSSSTSISEDKSGYEMGFSCSYNGRPSSAVWSESNEEKSLDTSCSCSQSEDFEEIFLSKDVFGNSSAFPSCESPFHFVLQRSPSFGHRTPIFSSPATSPGRHQKQVLRVIYDKESYNEVESLKKAQVAEEEEQCSPVSVLDPPFEDDDDRHVNVDDVDVDGNDSFDLECSYAVVQRTKQQLLHKLRRFEKLAELDPIELEKRMLEQEQDDDDDDDNEHESGSCDDGMVQEVVKTSFHNVPEGMKRLVTDLIGEEETEQSCYGDGEAVAKRVRQRLESWKEVESNTIDMMVGQDLRRSEGDGWKRSELQIRETALEVENAIFGLLMEELSEELVSSSTRV